MVLLAAGVAAMPAPAQTQDAYPPLKWVDRERYQTGANANDEGVAIAYWNQDPAGQNKHWIYATGWVTELKANGSVKGTRFATYKYDATKNVLGTPPYDARAFFPPQGVGISNGDTYKAVAMAVDPADGNVYVVGEAPHTAGVANNQDYLLVKYDTNLAVVWSGTGARLYNGTGNGNDIPVAIALDPATESVVVTGTSLGTSNDITTVARRKSDGALAAALWPAGGGQSEAGVRRYDNPVYQGNDRAAGVEPMILSSPQENTLVVVVLGTSSNGPALDDFVTMLWNGTGTSPAWTKFFDLGANDTARGLRVGPATSAVIFCNGYSEIPPDASKGDGGQDDFNAPINIDYSIVSYLENGVGTSVRWSDHQDYYNFGADYAVPLVVQDFPAGGGATGYDIFITGQAQNATTLDAWTLHYLDVPSGVVMDWDHGFNAGTNFGNGKAVAVPAQSGIPTSPFVTGAVGNNGGSDYMLTIKYRTDPTLLYVREYNKVYDNLGFDEGRGIVAKQVDGSSTNISVFVVGTSAASGNGRDFCVWKYRQ